MLNPSVEWTPSSTLGFNIVGFPMRTMLNVRSQIHSTLDWLWILLVALGMYLDHGHGWHDLALVSLFWGSAVLFIYVPMWTKDT